MKRLLFLGTAFATPAAAQSVDLTGIEREVAAFTGAAAVPVDRRLRLARCSAPHQLEWFGRRRDTVLVRCPEPGGWRLFVPLVRGAGADEAPTVLRGEAVTVTLAGPGFSVSQPGEAIEGGPVGAWIRVRVAGGGQPLRARVARPGLVQVDLGSETP